MLSVLRAVFPVAFVVLELGGMIFFYVRARAAQSAYLKRFDPVDGFPLDSIPGGLPSRVNAAIWDAMWDWQFDPALETLRREVWVRFRWMAAWIFGFPLTIAAIMVLLIVTGHGALLG